MTEDLQHPVVLICGGPAPDEEAIKYIPISTLIAVDSGLDHARSLQLKPDLLIGDLDSISTSGLQWASQQEIKVKEFPSDKDKSDFELALDYARGVSNRLLAIGSDSGRVDQLFGMIASLASAAPHFDSCHALIGKPTVPSPLARQTSTARTEQPYRFSQWGNSEWCFFARVSVGASRNYSSSRILAWIE